MRTVLLDLDGTLSDSRPGIAACFRYTVRQLGHDPDTAGDLTWAVGPPIAASIARLLRTFGDDRVDQAVAIYRARYSDVALYDCAVFPGVPPMLDTLRANGHPLRIATSKRRDFAERVIDHLGLGCYLGNVYGALPGGGLDEKQDLLAHILQVENLNAADCIMVGDRMHDIHAAQRNGIPSIGVLWGYGGEAELRKARADSLAASPADIAPLVAAAC